MKIAKVEASVTVLDEHGDTLFTTAGTLNQFTPDWVAVDKDSFVVVIYDPTGKTIRVESQVDFERGAGRPK